MESKKIGWFFLIALLMSCSIDDSQGIEEQLQFNTESPAKLYFGEDLPEPEGPADPIEDDHSEGNGRGYGMPVEWQKLSEDGIIKIEYYDADSDKSSYNPYVNDSYPRYVIRKEFSEKYPQLVLVKSLPNRSIEYWFIDKKIRDTNIIYDREEDEEITGFPNNFPRRRRSLHELVVKDIRDHDLINYLGD